MSDLTASMKIEAMAINKNNLSDVSKEKLYEDYPPKYIYVFRNTDATLSAT